MLIDCFTFNNEYDLLEGRLEYLNDVVDYFVIVEADITFSGIPRDYAYVKQAKRFSKWQHKIIYQPFVMDQTGLDFSTKAKKFDRNGAPWKVEVAQRNHFLNALKLFRGDDFVIINDIDEIPSKSAIQTILKHISPKMPAIICEQQMFYYNFNQIQVAPLYGTIITTVANTFKHTPDGIRLLRGTIPHVGGGGWHLSYWMTAEEIVEKVKSFSHQEYNNEKFNNVDTIQQMIDAGKDVFNRESNPFVPFDVNTLPKDFADVFLKFTPKNVVSKDK